jgi:hypothetical protein
MRKPVTVFQEWLELPDYMPVPTSNLPDVEKLFERYLIAVANSKVGEPILQGADFLPQQFR